MGRLTGAGDPIARFATGGRPVRQISAVALLVSMIAACSPASTATPPPTTTPTASPPGPTSTPTISAAPSITASPRPAAWTETYTNALTALRDVVAGPQGFIASGCTTDASGNCLEGLLLNSPDGTSWTAVDLDGAADTQISRLKWVGERLFAIGMRIDNEALKVEPVVWTSLDGKSWSRSVAPSSTSLAITDIIASPLGTLAVGVHAPYASEGSGFVLWRVASDGSFGVPTDVRPETVLVMGAAWTGDRFLAWGSSNPLGEVASTALLTSTDGKAWQVIPKIPAFSGSYVSQIAAGGGRLLAVGETSGPLATSPRAWTSVDGSTWDAAAVPTGPGAMVTLAVEGQQLVSRGREPIGAVDRPATWTSTDGTAWTRLTPGDDMPDVAGFGGLYRAVVAGRACVAGTFESDPAKPEPRAAIYCR
jgi:hypothetical protein